MGTCPRCGSEKVTDQVDELLMCDECSYVWSTGRKKLHHSARGGHKRKRKGVKR